MRVDTGAAFTDQAFAHHDHAHCAGDGLAAADRIARSRGARLTPVRRRTLEILLEAHRAMGAYDVLERLAKEGFGKQPPVAYRALEFLLDLGLVHRINRLNAFAACMHPGQAHNPAFLISAPAIWWLKPRRRRHGRRWKQRSMLPDSPWNLPALKRSGSVRPVR